MLNIADVAWVPFSIVSSNLLPTIYLLNVINNFLINQLSDKMLMYHKLASFPKYVRSGME